jgi:hypothetical protein
MSRDFVRCLEYTTGTIICWLGWYTSTSVGFSWLTGIAGVLAAIIAVISGLLALIPVLERLERD